LNVSPTGARSWILRATVGDRRRNIGLGSYPAVSLKEAHERAIAKREAIAAGIDPVLERKETASRLRASQALEMTFETAARRFMAAKSAEWRNSKHGDQWKNTLSTYACPLIGKMMVRHVSRAHVIEILEPIWSAMYRARSADRAAGARPSR
jgi:hypothetical protein